MTQHRAQPTRLRVCLVGPALLAAGALLAGCSGTNIGATISPSPTAISGTVSLWHYWTDREAKLVQQRIDAFTAAHPGVKVDVHPAQDDLKLSQVMAAGSSDVDVAWLASPLQLGTLCPSGTFMNLQPYVDRDHVDLALFTQVARTSTTFNDVRCSMPTLADTYGLYFNKTLLNAAGITTPPKTLDDLENVALKLTTYNDDGSIKTLGFNPLMGFYQNKAEAYAPLFGGTWMTNGKSSLNQASWIKFMNWQKEFIDKIGYQKLKTFTSGLGDEFSANNAFQSGQVAMMMDGEWRIAFIRDQAPDLQYGTAPFPTFDPSRYGAGYTVTNVLGINKGSKNVEAAWALVKYMSTDTDNLITLANGVSNIPPTTAALKGTYTLPSQFQTFLDIATNSNTSTPPNTTIGHGPQDAIANAWNDFQAKGGDPATILGAVDKSVNDSLGLSGQ